VTWFVENNLAPSREDAVKLGEKLVESDLLHHVHDDHHFKDGEIYNYIHIIIIILEKLFYRLKVVCTSGHRYLIVRRS
jgi:hypothetical protein